MKTIQSLSFPLFVKWYITQRCNIRCSHCYLTDYKKSPDLDRILDVIDFLGRKHTAGITLLGGEPLTRPDLPVIVDKISLHDIDLKIATNAMLVTAPTARRLADAGASRYQVSMEGSTMSSNDAIRGRGAFERALAGIRILTDVGAEITLAFTLNGKNYSQIDSMFELAAILGVKTLKFNAFIPIGTGKSLHQDYFLSASACRIIESDISRCTMEYPQIKVDAKAFDRESKKCSCVDKSKTFGCGAGTTSIVINSDFTLSACDMLTESDRTSNPIQSPNDIERFWQADELFQRWRGKVRSKEIHTIKFFTDVHQRGCHVAFNSYQANIFED